MRLSIEAVMAMLPRAMSEPDDAAIERRAMELAVADPDYVLIDELLSTDAHKQFRHEIARRMLDAARGRPVDVLGLIPAFAAAATDVRASLITAYREEAERDLEPDALDGHARSMHLERGA